MKRESHVSTEAPLIDRRRFLHRAGGFGVVCLLPTLAGCEILAARSNDRYTVEINQHRRFAPANLTIPVGSTVVWDNMSSMRHAVTTDASLLDDGESIALPQGVQPFTSDDLFSGDTWVLRFTIPGSYVYVCPYHYDVGMIGTVVVEE